MKLYEGDKQYNSKADQWEAIKTAMLETEPTKVKKKVTKSMYNRLLAVIKKKGHDIKMYRVQRLIIWVYYLLL